MSKYNTLIDDFKFEYTLEGNKATLYATHKTLDIQFGRMVQDVLDISENRALVVQNFLYNNIFRDILIAAELGRVEMGEKDSKTAKYDFTSQKWIINE